jgi:putative colanic acid biosynthesis UDP-glucose lipid carrier transferase
MPRTGIIREHSSGLSWVQRLLDIIAIVGVLYASLVVYGQRWSESYSLTAATTLALFGFVAEYNGLYRSYQSERLGVVLTRLCVVWFFVLAFLLLIGFATKTSTRFSRVATTLWFVATPLLLGTTRICIRIVIRHLGILGRNSRPVAIIGCTPLAARLIDILSGDPALGLSVLGIFDDRVQARQDRPHDLTAKVVGNVEQLIAEIQKGNIDQVFLALPLRAEARVTDILYRLADTTATVYYVPDLFAFDLLRARLTSVGGVPVISVFDSPFQGVDGSLKRAEDLILGILALIIACLPMIFVAIAIKLTTRGPVLFAQRRYGLGGREIRVFKFRTMSVTEDGKRVVRATQNDQRITKIGALLRRTSIDELPQLFNVIGGSMSLVGPRPHAVAHNEQYRTLVSNYMLRHKVKPGITGWAQVNGLRGETDITEKMQKRVEYDLYYINHWSLALDIKIMWMTVFGSRTRKNAF